MESLSERPSFKILWESSVEAFEEFERNGFISKECSIKLYHAAVHDNEAIGVCTIVSLSLDGRDPIKYPHQLAMLILTNAGEVGTYRELERMYIALQKFSRTMRDPIIESLKKDPNSYVGATFKLLDHVLENTKGKTIDWA